MTRFLSIARYSALAVLLLMMLSLAPPIEPIVVEVGEILELKVDSMNGDSYSWDIYNDSTVNFAVVDGTAVADGDALYVNGVNTGKSVQVQWLKRGIYFYKVTAYDVTGCTNNLKMGMVKVIPARPKAKLTTTPVCEADPVKIQVDLTGESPWSFTITDGVRSWDFSGVTETPFEAVLVPGPRTATSYWVTVVKDFWGENLKPTDPVPQEVNPKPATSVIYQYEP
ncbi:MAG: hypothetical protein WC384_05805 [Prolixibacteraceae bacterium]